MTIFGRDEVMLEISETSNVSDFCHFDIFTGLKPGLTKQEAEVILGSTSSETYFERQGWDKVYRFPRENGVVEIIHQKSASSDGEEYFYRWFLRFKPADSRIESHISSQVIEILQAAEIPVDYSVKIFNDSASVKFIVKDSRIEEIWWLHDGSSMVSAPAARDEVEAAPLR